MMNVGELPPEMEHERAGLEADHVTHREVAFHEATALTRSAARVAPGAAGTTTLSVGGATTFVDLEEGLQVRQLRLMGRTFLIEEEAGGVAWVLTSDVGTHLGHEVYRAVGHRGHEIVEAWFAPGIPSPVGPDAYHGLPGLILVLSVDGGRRVFTATQVTLEPLASLPSRPRDGRRVTAEEYDRLLAESVAAIERLSDVLGGSVSVIRHQ